MLIQPNDRILFYGDSITDCGRDREDPAALGNGYVKVIADRLAEQKPDWNLTVLNRGISGNRIYDLEDRVERDVIEEKPTVVSFLIGINDTWHFFNHQKESPISDFAAAYGRILKRLKAEISPKILICEPFLLPIPEDRRKWRPDLDARISVIRDLAWEFELPYLPLDGLYAAASVGTGHAHWLPDGVHPSEAGHELIAQNWLRLVESL